ncbi:MAG TPA: YrhK family protein [Conexibacter sp.]|jgi:hypothetical protein
MSVWWRPDRLAWWTGLLFAIGSVLFLVPGVAALGSSADWIGVAFFAGSIFFTSAAGLQLLAASEVPHRARPAHERRMLRPRAWLPRAVDWLAAAVQFPGTILFNVNTFEALNHALDPTQVNVRVWTPDMIGSGCFLVASLLAFANSEHRWVSFRPHDLDWWIAGANLLGSIAFGISAVAAFVRPATGTAVNDAIANGGTAAGAACFLIGALLLPVQADRQQGAGPVGGPEPPPQPSAAREA